ncbi:YcfL family protein [Rubellicoccus peritrichatus]|uniref:YcfL family protein n=1 Tax=Rubellicoccus peritrichatus TaxID=3080537 RepID=A0AAQ3LBU3_9BACT|nr:YcfL family protein [Puniceicoccus sp. CR14]WOO41512.1 YcfL family protein [Puniceicoccus sp. CR14]
MKNLFLLASAACLFLTACNSVNTVERAEPQSNPNLIAIKKVITDPALQSKVSVVDVNEGTVSDDLLKIQVKLENLTYDLQQFNYQFIWIDKDGFAVTSPTPIWKAGQIQGRETIFINGIAPNPRVVDFQMKVLARQSYSSGLRDVPRAGPAGKH